MSDERPGEIDLESVAPPVAAEPVVAAAAELPVEAPEPEPEPEPEPAKAAKPGMLEELIEHRTVRRNLERERQTLAPVLSRLTPELQEAITEGRFLVKPKPSSADGQNEQLRQYAEELRLYTTDAQGNQVPDIDAAGRVAKVVRREVSEQVAPLRQSAALTAARKNIDVAVEYAKTNGYDVDSVRQHYENALTAPNGAAMVADPGVAEELWYGAIGRATANGKLRQQAAKPAPPPAIPSESSGKRASANSVQLSPALAKVYADAGLDPNTTPSATKPPVVDASGHMALE